MNEIEPHILKLLTIEGFCNLYYQYCKEYSTQELAYEAAERIFQNTFKKRKYANFESFRQMRNRMLKGK